MHSSYARYSNYKRHVEFKRVGLILNAVREYYPRASGEVIGLDLGCGQGDSLLKAAGFKVVNIRQTDLAFSFLPLLKKSHKLGKWDCSLADKLPLQLVSGWYLCCQKK